MVEDVVIELTSELNFGLTGATKLSDEVADAPISSHGWDQPIAPALHEGTRILPRHGADRGKDLVDAGHGGLPHLAVDPLGGETEAPELAGAYRLRLRG